jgi:hypothetical protein
MSWLMRADGAALRVALDVLPPLLLRAVFLRLRVAPAVSPESFRPRDVWLTMVFAFLCRLVVMSVDLDQEFTIPADLVDQQPAGHAARGARPPAELPEKPEPQYQACAQEVRPSARREVHRLACSGLVMVLQMLRRTALPAESRSGKVRCGSE